jgi:hypothetical protein
MSQLILRGMGQSHTMHVESFSTAMSASIQSVQVQAHQHHFPIRVDQPDLFFVVRFINSAEKKTFQNFARNHQMNALTATVRPPWITLWWPEREMYNWTGYINSYMAGSKRFSVASTIQFSVKLVDSLVSRRTTAWSTGANPSSIFGPQIPWGASRMPEYPPTDTDSESGGLIPPTAPSGSGGGDGGGGSW